MNIVERAKSILLKPKDTWPIIDAESATAAGLYSGYLAILAAIPAVCGFIGMSLIGFGGFGVSIRVPIAAGLANMVVSYVLSLAGIYVLALIIDALAPTFGGTKNSLQALKVAVYGSTAALVGGVFSLVPALSILGLLAALYSIYLVYTGLPVLMKSPQEKSVAYTAVVIVAAVVVGIVIGAVASVFTSRSMALGYGAVDSSPASITMHTPSGQVKIDAAALEAAGKKMAAAAQAMERAQQPGGDVGAATAVAGSVAAAAMGAMGGGDGAPIPADILKAALPAQLSGFARTAIEAQQGAASGHGHR
ncbi:Yip1 family protein [Ramlibacter sp. H39-3-26]|uniref:Yip1 family protein n=1 Tax=Curvibacter soli TaxID=3031331 RepID=UPI0023DBC425|nr:Yip1 family protein [Ramlibacter sp. H39-3-26]MDF1484854.1 Yip1 family protein [Ramlibacter sp. H39-3-26]